MSSKRAIRRRSCTGKKRFTEHRDASNAIGALHRRKGWQGELQAYRCGFCGGWHFGHTGRD